jgi:ATP-dependent DNA helicase RecQ
MMRLLTVFNVPPSAGGCKAVHEATAPDSSAEARIRIRAIPSVDSARDTSIDRIARERFGVEGLRPLQRLVIASILDAASAEDGADRFKRRLVVLPTGGGKSLCFQLPALLLRGPSLVVYPLLSLMADQSRRLREARIPHILLRGGMGPDEASKARSSLRGGFKGIIIANPEIMGFPPWRDLLLGAGVAHLVVDEAHTLVSWGRDFRPAFLSLGGFAEEAGIPLVSAFTATADPVTEAGIAEILFLGSHFERITASPDRPNIRYEVTPCLSRSAELEGILRSRTGPAIVFRMTRKGTETLASDLSKRFPGVDVYFYHAGLSREEKTRIEASFFASEAGILVATCAYGMGVDKGNVRVVVHFDPPPSVESYLQESGRAGRDGKPALAVLLRNGASFPDRPIPFPSLLGIIAEERSSAVKRYASEAPPCRRSYLLGAMGLALAEGYRPVSCCDACDGTAASGSADERKALSWIRRNPRRFGSGELASLLAAESKAGKGMRFRDADEAVSALLISRKALASKRGPWKGMLRVPLSKSSVLERGGRRALVLSLILHVFFRLLRRAPPAHPFLPVTLDGFSLAGRGFRLLRRGGRGLGSGRAFASLHRPYDLSHEGHAVLGLLGPAEGDETDDEEKKQEHDEGEKGLPGLEGLEDDGKVITIHAGISGRVSSEAKLASPSLSGS